MKTTPVRSRCGRAVALPLAEGVWQCECGEEFTLVSDGAGGFHLHGFVDLQRPLDVAAPVPLRHVRAEDIARAVSGSVTGV